MRPIRSQWNVKMNKKKDRINNSNMCLHGVIHYLLVVRIGKDIYSKDRIYYIRVCVRPLCAAVGLRLQRLAHVTSIVYTMQKP